MWTAIGWCFAVAMGLAIFVAVVVYLPLFLYVLPYYAWLGWNAGTKGIPRDASNKKIKTFAGLLHEVKNATLAYTGHKDRIQY